MAIRPPETRLWWNEPLHWPEILPGGEGVLFTIVSGRQVENAQIAVLSLVTGEVEVLRDPDTGEVLDESMTEVARLTVSQVKEKLSICDVTSGDASAVAKGMTIHRP